MSATTMRAMVLERSPGELRLAELPRPAPGPGQLLIKVSACGVCRTDLHVVGTDGARLMSAVEDAIRGTDAVAERGETVLEDVFIRLMNASEDNVPAAGSGP